MAIQALLVILAVLLVLLFLGVPISYAIAVSSLTAVLSSIDLNVAVLTAAQRTFVGMSKFSLTAIPFFILAGNIMNQGGIAKRLVDFVMAILGKMPGALLVTNIGTNALFGAISGSASAAAAAVGSMIRDGADEQGYDPAVTAATNAASSCSGLLIPPSNALITYSLASGGTSVAALFMAGYIPGIIWALCCCVVGVLLAVKLGYKGTPGKFDWKNLGICTLRALPSLSLIIVVIGGIIGGVFSATEGSAIAVAYALILAFCYRSINLKSLWKIIVDSAKMSGMVVFLVGVSNILGWVMAFLQIPDAVAAALLSLTSNKYIILLIMTMPTQVSALGFLQLITKMGLKNSFIPLIVPSIAAPTVVFFMKQYLDASLPMEIVEAARIDGAGEFYTFNKIVLPIMKPALAVQAIFSFVASWNNYFIPALVLDSADKKTLPILIAQLRSADILKFDMGKVYMMVAIAILPVIIVYLLLSKFIVRGVALGGVKG